MLEHVVLTFANTDQLVMSEKSHYLKCVPNEERTIRGDIRFKKALRRFSREDGKPGNARFSFFKKILNIVYARYTSVFQY